MLKVVLFYQVLKLFKGGGDPGCDWFQEIYNIACGFKKIVELRAFFEGKQVYFLILFSSNCAGI